MRQVCDGEEEKKKNDKKRGTFKSLPVDRPNTDRLERRTLVPIKNMLRTLGKGAKKKGNFH